MDPLVVNAAVTLPPSDFTWSAARASGPGGQNVNKVASKVELRFDLAGTLALNDEVKARVRALAGSRLDADGQVRVVSQATRDQSRNLDDARDKLRVLVLEALTPPKPRRATKPTRASKARRLTEKHHVAERKKGRTKGSANE
jgi:ribosome-associated protein